MEPSLSTVCDLLRGLVSDGAASLGPETRLITSGLLDSYAVLDLVERLEAEFGIVVQRTDVTPENLDTPARVVAWLQRKRGGA